MGQTHIAINTDKEEYIVPANLGKGIKMSEMIPNRFGHILVYLQSFREANQGSDFTPTENEGRWVGDTVVVVGASSIMFDVAVKMFDEISDEIADDFNEAVRDDLDRLDYVRLKDEKVDHSKSADRISDLEAAMMLIGFRELQE